MKKLPLFSIVLAVAILFSADANAQRYDLGAGVAVKVDYFRFSAGLLGDLNAKDGVYIGLEAYKQVFLPNFYLGFETGWAGTSGSISGNLYSDSFMYQGRYSVDTDVSYVPLEFNAKYVLPLNPNLDLGAGGGFSLNYFDIEGTIGHIGSVSDNDWVWGGQFFTELNYKYQNWRFGLNAKYQLTEDLHLFGVNTGSSADNLRIGGQVGFNF